MNERKMSRNIELIETDKKETDVIQTHPNNPEAIEGSLLVEKNNILEVPLYQVISFIIIFYLYFYFTLSFLENFYQFLSRCLLSVL